MAELTEYSDWEHQEDTASKRVTDVGSSQQLYIDYATRVDGQPVFVGKGARGLATNANGWLVYNFSYDSNGNIISKQSAIGAWTNRATLPYS